jgi:succinate dehydrogenase/fumarate reductase flavoprotein subunit
VTSYKDDLLDIDAAYDVIVAGYGFAGAVAAIAAADAGATVLLVEKMPDPGGISICAGGGLRLPRNAPETLAYLRATNDGTTPDDVLAAFIEEAKTIDGFVEELARSNGATVGRTERPANYPLAGADSMYFLQIDDVPGFDVARDYPFAHALGKGPHMFKVLQDNVDKRAIDVRVGVAAQRLDIGPDGAVRGIKLSDGAREITVAAHGGVILACGGFEADGAMQRQFWQLNPVHSAAFAGNTGDGIRMAQEAGAGLWHMWHYHGTYGLKHPDFPFAIRTKRLPDWTPGLREVNAAMAWILVDRDGRRFMNEYEPYMQDTGHRGLEAMDFRTMQQSRVPCWMIFDDAGRALYPIGQAIWNDRSVEPFQWSSDNLAEVEAGVIKRADSVEELANLIGCPAEKLDATLEGWNAACQAGSDDLGRPVASMVTVAKPPFFAAEIWPVVSNTQGGPVHDAARRVLNPYGEPIAGLYSAGELGGIWGWLYLSGGNLTECFVSGRLAARGASRLV